MQKSKMLFNLFLYSWLVVAFGFIFELNAQGVAINTNGNLKRFPNSPNSPNLRGLAATRFRHQNTQVHLTCKITFIVRPPQPKKKAIPNFKTKNVG